MIEEYEKAVAEILPAVRSFIAKELKERYNMKEGAIAERLDVAQAAVSKYISGKYSDKVKSVEAMIQEQHDALDAYIAKLAEGKKEYANVCICSVCGMINKFNCAFSAAKPNQSV